MKRFLSVILIFLACFGFTAKLMQLDQLTGTELVAKDYQEADEKGEKEQKEKDTIEEIPFPAAIDFVAFERTNIQAPHHNSFSEGHYSSPDNPPDFL